ncbi:MAG: LamG-like jellyroll fold domain-containing protein [Pseudomonadota bacterium]
MTVGSSATDVISINIPGLVSSLWHHIEFSENGNNWYVFVDGNLVATASNAIRPANYTSTVFIGNNNSTMFYKGYLDEIRVSKVNRHTASFTVPTAAYSAASGGKVYIQTPRPAKGFKFYVSHANATAATVQGAVWNGSIFYDLANSITDGTKDGGGTKTLAQTGSITFTSTVSSAKVKYLYGTVAYTYMFSFSGIDADTAIYHVTADCPFQSITDFWDGMGRYISKFYLYKAAYQDFSVNVYEDRYDSTDPTTYVELDSLTAAQDVEVGFFERMTAVQFTMVSGKVNTTANTTLTVYYWTGSAYSSVGVITDGTSVAAISLSNPGMVSWNSPSATAEHKKTVNNGIPMYFYKFVWNQTLSADVQVSHVYGIPAQQTIRGYKFPLFGQERLLLCNNVDEDRNSLLYSADGTVQVFNGSDSGKIYFGDNSDLTCGCNVFSQFAQSLYNITLVFKDKEMWGLVRGTDGWQKYPISETIGCNCPKTLKTAVIPPIAEDKGGNRNIAIWLRSSDGVYVSDGRHPIMVSHDIRDYFDQNSATHINQAYAQSAAGWVDQDKLEYHLVFATTTGTVTANDIELVLDLRRWKWFKVSRGSGLNLQCGVIVTDTYGNNHTYGFIDTGYMERLEYGNTQDGTSITSTFQTGDFPLIEGDLLTDTRVRKFIQAMVAKVTTTANVKLTHFTDTQDEILTLDVAAGTPWAVNDTITGNTSGTTCKITRINSTTSFAVRDRTGDFTLNEVLTNGTYAADQGELFPTITGPVDYVCDPTLANYRVTFPVKDANSLPAIVHSVKETITVSNETVGFEPISLMLFYEAVRDHVS